MAILFYCCKTYPFDLGELLNRDEVTVRFAIADNFLRFSQAYAN
jgi:hypothetical protein